LLQGKDEAAQYNTSEAALTGYSDETVNAVKSWLTSAGISDKRIKHSDSLGWLKFDATVDEAEELLNAKYHVWEHSETGQPHVACDEYR
jgi:tripeptidyl-peptidase-1